MKPPICAVCRKDFRRSPGEGGLVRFRLSETDQAFNQRLREKRMVGHPAGTAWFCGKHIKTAKALKHLTLGEALKQIS